MKNGRWLLGIGALLIILTGAIDGTASDSGNSPGSEKAGLLLVAFGTSDPAARVAFENIHRMVTAQYPGIPVRWAYTSHVIRRKLAGQGILLDSPEAALARMMDDGFTHVAVQSLHTIGGEEYHELSRTVAAFNTMDGFQRIVLGDPLLTTQEDMARAVQAVMEMIPKNRKKHEAVVLMGHGSHHPANAFYAALMFQLQLVDPDIFIGTVEGSPQVGLLRELMHKKKIKKAWLLPFMSVAGDHAKNDLAGNRDDSWQSILTRAGIQCTAVLKGTAEYDGFADIWVSHAGEALRRCRAGN